MVCKKNSNRDSLAVGRSAASLSAIATSGPCGHDSGGKLAWAGTEAKADDGAHNGVSARGGLRPNTSSEVRLFQILFICLAVLRPPSLCRYINTHPHPPSKPP